MNADIQAGSLKYVDELISVRPVGWVSSGMPIDGKGWSRWREVSTITIRDEYVEALLGLDDFSHVIVIYWMHLARPLEGLLVRPRNRDDLPFVGAFVSRGPARPNPIGLTVCELVEVLRNTIKVRGLDAYSGTPIMDIKPYDYYDVVKGPRVPGWFISLWKERADDRPGWVGP